MNKMTYMKRYKGSDDWQEVSYEEALNTVLGSYKDNAEVRNMLTTGNYIPCKFSEIRVYEDQESGE